MYCPKCGREMEDGAAFCPGCGAQMDAPQQTAASSAGAAANAAGAAARAASQGILTFLKGYLKAPGVATKELLKQKNMVVPIILLVIQAIVAGLLMFSVFTGLITALKKMVLTAAAASAAQSRDLIYAFVANMRDVNMNDIASIPQIGPSFIACLGWGILAAVVAIGVFVVLVFALSKLMGSNRSIQDALIVCGAHSVLVTAVLLLSFLFFFFSLPIGAILFVVALLTWAATGVLSARRMVDDHKSGKFLISYVAVLLITMVVAGFVGLKCLEGGFRSIGMDVAGQRMTIGQYMDMAKMAGKQINYLDMLFELRELF